MAKGLSMEYEEEVAEKCDLGWAVAGVTVRAARKQNPAATSTLLAAFRLRLHLDRAHRKEAEPGLHLNPMHRKEAGPGGHLVPAFTQAIESHQRRITDAILEHALKICSDKNVEVKTQVVVGDPKEKICEVAAELKADLLVMGCRAFGPVKRMFLGSVSNYCINSVGCPVVVIKGT
ncbi:Universal stress protein A-like protein [Triticum urartu]|uniref:Universal stress protein A-like protein n=1 Tax=Triticum urartu TaxID=4572 RepID=M7ZE29_TRIUA|nr:Universal stress protein A-like protein [Triticum urartu]